MTTDAPIAPSDAERARLSHADIAAPTDDDIAWADKAVELLSSAAQAAATIAERSTKKNNTIGRVTAQSAWCDVSASDAPADATGHDRALLAAAIERLTAILRTLRLHLLLAENGWSVLPSLLLRADDTGSAFLLAVRNAACSPGDRVAPLDVPIATKHTGTDFTGMRDRLVRFRVALRDGMTPARDSSQPQWNLMVRLLETPGGEWDGVAMRYAVQAPDRAAALRVGLTSAVRYGWVMRGAPMVMEAIELIEASTSRLD